MIGIYRQVYLYIGVLGSVVWGTVHSLREEHSLLGVGVFFYIHIYGLVA